MADTGKRFWIGFRWGLVGTLAMSGLMLLGVLTGVAPMPKPIPMAMMARIFGPDTAKPLLMVLAIGAHFGYGATWAGILASATRPVTFWKGIGLGVGLWFLMQIIVLPLIGWGAFGASASPRIWFATLILHLVYGGTVGLLVDRHPRAEHPRHRPLQPAVGHR